MKLTTILRQLHDHPSITKAASRLFHRIAISKQLNAVPYLRHKPWQLLQLCQPYAAWSTRNCTSLAPRLVTVVFGLGTRLHARICTTLENGILCNGQQPDRAENSFIDQGKLVAMKCWVVVKLRTVIRISSVDGKYLNHFWDIVVEHCGLHKKERKKEDEKWHFCNRTLCI